MTAPQGKGVRLVWVVVPVVAWNVILGPFLPQGYASDQGVPQWLVWTEHALRVGIFGMPLVLWPTAEHRRAAWAVVGSGLCLYFISWLPILLDSELAQLQPWALLPAVTPAVWLGGLVWLSGSRVYGIVAVLFLVTHVAHQIVAGP